MRVVQGLSFAIASVMAVSEDMFPDWMIPLYKCTHYFQSCNECWRSDGAGALVKGKIPAKYQKNFFILCNGSRAIACSHCKDHYTGKGTLRLQIRRSSHHGAIHSTAFIYI